MRALDETDLAFLLCVLLCFLHRIVFLDLLRRQDLSHSGRETVREDYLLSNEYRAEEVEGRLGQLREMAAATLGLAPEDVDMAGANAFYVLKGSYIDASLDEAVARYGSMDDYIREGLGISDEEVAHLRGTLLEDTH